MSTRCIFGLFVFGSNSTIIYRFLTDDLYTHLIECFKRKGAPFNEDSTEDNQADDNNDTEPKLSVDDALAQQLSMLIRVYEGTSSCHNPVKHIKLDTGIQVFFDQFADNSLICMADSSFDSMVVLKTINLLKALIKFHIGVLPFISYNASDQLIDRISASLQYFLNNITTNQALLFESCEHLLINSLIREQCRDVCSMISNEVQNMIKVPRKIIIITCHDKIVYIHRSTDQSPLNNGDMFLLLLNNTSRRWRKEFEAQKSRLSAMAHRYQRKPEGQTNSQPSSARTTTDNLHFGATDRTQSCPDFTSTFNMETERTHQSEVVFLKTTTRVIAPFTLFTIPLVNHLSVLILVEWENSTVCSNLYILIRQLDTYANHGLFPYDKLIAQVKAVESSAAVRRYFEENNYPANILADIVEQAHTLHKSSTYIHGDTEQRQQIGQRIVRHFTEMSRLASDAFRYLFFDSDEYARRSGVDIGGGEDAEVQMDDVGPSQTRLRKNEYDTSPMTRKLRRKIIYKLEDWFSFIEVKSQRNITINFCVNDFPGLVHFVFVDRSRGQICTPTLIPDDTQLNPFNNHPYHSKCILEKKILAFEIECLSTLQQGFTAYTMSDEHFTYNYTLRLQENNGASMRLYKSLGQSQLPSVLHHDFYRALAEEYYPWLVYQTSVACFELISVHLRIVPPSIVRAQCEQLWPKLMEPFE